MMIDILNNFGSHERVLEVYDPQAMFIIIYAKEYSNISHANQCCDKFLPRKTKGK